MGSSDPPKQTVGYHYSLGMHLVLCHGPIDGVKQIWVGEKCAWPNADDPTELAADGTTLASIDEANLMGGEEKEGGVVGDVDIAYGAASQTKNSYLASILDSVNGYIPAFRGLVSVILKCVRVGTSPYIKQWSFLAKRTSILNDGSVQWYAAKADIDGDLNPAHIIRECLTNTQWGLGYSTGYIDDTSFTAAADTLYAESFGLSYLWDANTSVEDFIGEMLKHIDGMLFQDIETGKFNLVLARDDYDVGDLEEFDASIISDVQDYKRPTYGEITNQIVVKYSNIEEDKDATATAQDIAMIDLQGGAIIESQVNYPGITKAELANTIAARELRQATTLLARATVYGNRSMSHLRPNDVFLLTWPILGISQMPVRIMQINYGSLTEGVIRFDVVEDVFKAASALYATPPATGWTDPVSDPQPAPARLLTEIPYWNLVRALGQSYVESNLDDDSGFLGVGALKPTSDAFDYELLVRDSPSSEFSSRGRGDFTPTATLSADLPMNAADAVIALENVVDLDVVEVNTYAVIGGEIVKIKDVDTADNEITIARGVLDTVPAAHSDGDRIWFLGTINTLVSREYAATEQPGVKILPATGKGQYPEASATAYNASVMNSRQIRPYPPGDFKINTVSYLSSFTGQPTISWAHRDRTQQTVTLIEHDEASIGPEAGTTYTLKIYDEGDSLLRTETGLTGTSYEYTEANEQADRGDSYSATTISAAASDNSFNDSASGFSGMAIGQYIPVTGFTEAANNGLFKIESITSSKIVVSGGTLVDEAAGDSVEIAPLSPELRFELWSVRDGYDSWQSYDLTVNRI